MNGEVYNVQVEEEEPSRTEHDATVEAAEIEWEARKEIAETEWEARKEIAGSTTEVSSVMRWVVVGCLLILIAVYPDSFVAIINALRR